MKLLTTLFVAFVTLFVYAAPAEANGFLRFQRNFDFGARPGLNSQESWFYNQTTRRFNHPDVQNHLASRINHRMSEGFSENGLTGNGSLRWTMQMYPSQSESSWSPNGQMTRVCRQFTVRFNIDYRTLDSVNRQVYQRQTYVQGTLCSPNGGHTWYQERDFSVGH